MLNYGNIIYKEWLLEVDKVEITHNANTINLSALLVEDDAIARPEKIRKISLDPEDPLNKIVVYFSEVVSGRLQIVQAGPIPVASLSVEERVEISRPLTGDYFWDVPANKRWWRTYSKWIPFVFVFVDTPSVQLSEIEYKDCANLRISRVTKRGFEVRCESAYSWDNSVSFTWEAIAQDTGGSGGDDDDD